MIEVLGTTAVEGKELCHAKNLYWHQTVTMKVEEDYSKVEGDKYKTWS